MIDVINDLKEEKRKLEKLLKQLYEIGNTYLFLYSDTNYMINRLIDEIEEEINGVERIIKKYDKWN